MYEITLYVKANGTLATEQKGVLKLGTENEIKRTRLLFEVDSRIEGKYRYLKLVTRNLSCLYRISNNSIVLSKTITSQEGKWLVSFISTDELIANNVIKGNYAFITEPIEAVVTKGIMGQASESEELRMLNEVLSMDFVKLDIIDGVSRIGPYFMYNSRKTFDLTIGKDVRSIGAYAFYDATINKLEFADDSILESLEDASFYHINFNPCEIVIPKSVKSWGKHVFETSKGNVTLTFQKGSSLRELGSYAFWDTPFSSIELPDGLATFAGNTYVIKNSASLKKLWIPNTLTANVPANAIYGCDSLTDITLERDFNVSANFSNCTNLGRDSIVDMLYSLKNLNGTTSKSLTIGSANLTKLSDADKAIATNKNWTLS